MKKLRLILGVSCAMAIASGCLIASSLGKQPERDARIIVEVNRKVDTLNEEGIRNTQNAVYNNIKQYATSNVKLIQRYSELNNAFVMEINSKDIEAVKEVPGVASVTVDTMHWVRSYNDDGCVSFGEEAGDQALNDNDNISAATMHKPENTNDGEGTIVAILDNEFHFRGKTNSAAGWHHEVYDALPADCGTRYTFASIKTIVGLNAKTRKFGAKAGEEGSEYLNSKVPFYFDYGGVSTLYGKTGTPKYDVHSELTYHGSHVSSITAANAPEYKGIAPKAQLALMKVFTEYDAKGGMGEKLGFSTHSGAYDTVILSALEDCIKLKVDGINMSLGSDLDDFDGESITLKTLTRLNESGILTSISAGNAGKTSYSSTGAYANWSLDTVETGILSSYANNDASMTIASGHPTQIFYENAFQTEIGGVNRIVAFEDQIVNRDGFDDDYNREYRIKDLYHGGEHDLDWVYIPGFGTTADYNGKDVGDKIAVVNRGSTSFADKYATAVGQGAKGLVIINNDPTASSFNFRCSFGDGFNPSMPCALVLYQDKPFFESNESGSFGLINKQVSDNPNKYTVSNFSSDGMKFDLNLKPDITAPGDNIKGAVPEHAMTNLTKEERESDEYKYKCYQYLSGTSMSAPNYAGCQALLTSEVAGPIYHEAKANSTAVTAEQLAEIDAYRATVNMRLMSTADPMHDQVENPETNVISITSPRIQGAGMVDLDGALNSDVYLEGFEKLDENENPIGLGKSKICLRNNEDIAKGDIKLSFLAHNESQEPRQYDVKFNVMRPALATPNNVVTKDYDYKGEIDNIEMLSGVSYYDVAIKQMAVAPGLLAYKDAVKVSKDILYYASEADYQNNVKSTIKMGYYYNASHDGADWQPLPSYLAQSTMDVQVAEVTQAAITVQPGDSVVTLDPYSLTEEVKNAILENYEYGCMIEGFVTLTSKDGKADLSIPYLGFYSGTDRDPDASYETVPVAEPFNFEKDQTTVYPSDLVNDIAKSLIGKDNVNFESMIVAGYAERPQSINTDSILSNDSSFDRLTGFYKVGTDPLTGEYTANPGNDIYIGSAKSTNTMIIQQFMLRSVVDNYFSIISKETGDVVYQSALEDMLFGDTLGKWSLYKSHVDANYLSAGYVAHRASAIVPLYNEATGEAFPSGEYELKFNYQLAATGTWVDKSYTIHIDSEAPVVKTMTQYRDAEGVNRVRVYFQEDKLSYATVGYNRIDEIFYDDENKLYYIDLTAEFVKEAVEEISSDENNPKLFIGAVDYARGQSGCLVKFKDINNIRAGITTLQGENITVRMDFSYNDGVLKVTDNAGRTINVEGKLLLNGFPATYNPPVNPGTPSTSRTSNSNTGLIISLAIAIPAAIITLGVLAYILSKKRKGVR